MKRILVAHPDRYGRFGHQTLNIYAALQLAYMTDSLLLSPKYMYFTDRWNEFADWSLSKYTTDKIIGNRNNFYLGNDVADVNGNRRWRIDSIKHIIKIIEKIQSYPSDSLINLPFDQMPGIMLKLKERDDMTQDLNNIFKVNDWPKMQSRFACVHIRRGDVTPERHPDWYISDEFYISLIIVLSQSLPVDFKIHVCTQGDVSNLKTNLSKLIDSSKLVINTTDQLFANDNEIHDFRLMSQASLLVTGRSSFSNWAETMYMRKAVIHINKDANHDSKSCVINPSVPEQIWTSSLRQMIRDCFSE